ncbi:PQQ-binding-like beta-propeller repeat protein [Streptomyces sp. NPDC018610]|uniref:outer membrane protein assembly factor BamB family protein n=1 Tax=Streptomyces sp. NPDC018610 TaxID=3365049 RepID=UPI0037A66463
MTQPPNQPPQGGFGAPEPQDRPPQPPAPPQGGGFGAPQTPQGAPAPQGAPDPRQATPPSPAQPPQGAPQTPPAPPAGPPQPQPGYGYPQQPAQAPAPGPYAQPGPYGAPQPGPYGAPAPGAPAPGPYGQPPQPGPYGQPQQPGPYGAPQPGPYGTPQPGYGYPGQPQYPGGPGGPGTPPPGGSRNPFKGRPAVVIGAAVAALLVVGGTVWAVNGGGGDGGKKPVAEKSDDAKPSGSGGATDAPANPGDGSGDGGDDPENLNDGRQAGEAKVLWYKQAPDAPGSGADAPGMWITDKAAVKAAYKQVFAYDVADGKPTWAPVSFPQKICAVTPDKSADDKVVVAYESGSSDRATCNQLQQLDLNTGKKGWSVKVPEGQLFDSTLTIELSITGKTLMVDRSQSGVAYDLDSGRKLYDKQKYGEACFPTAFAGGPRLIQVASCGAGGENEHDEVQLLDPATGKAKWTRKIPKGWSVQRAYSVDPLVLYSTDEKKHWNVSTLNDDGSVRSQVDVKGSFAPECGWALIDRDLQGCQGVAADAGTLYLPTQVTTGANEIVAVNLATGKEKWRVKSPEDTTMLPIKVEGGKLIAYVEPSYDGGGQVVSVPTAGSSHTTTKLLQNPENTADIENGFFSRDIDWVDGRFYISTTRLSGSDKSKEKLMLAFGD